MGRFLWPVAALLLTCAITLPCLALVLEERPERILNAFASLFNALLSAYLGLIPVARDRSTLFIAVFIVALGTSIAAAIVAVALAFSHSDGEVAASNLIRLLLGPFQNYIFVTILVSFNRSVGDENSSQG